MCELICSISFLAKKENTHTGTFASFLLYRNNRNSSSSSNNRGTHLISCFNLPPNSRSISNDSNSGNKWMNLKVDTKCQSAKKRVEKIAGIERNWAKMGEEEEKESGKRWKVKESKTWTPISLSLWVQPTKTEDWKKREKKGKCELPKQWEREKWEGKKATTWDGEQCFMLAVVLIKDTRKLAHQPTAKTKTKTKSNTKRRRR